MHYYHQTDRQAFTLVELLVVVAIIVLLVSMIIGVIYPMLKGNVKSRETARRLDNLVTSIEMYGTGQGQAVGPLFRMVSGRDLRLVPLREVLSELTRHRPNLLDSTDLNDFPPGLASRAYLDSLDRKGDIPGKWRLSGSGMEYHIAFRDVQLSSMKSDQALRLELYGPVRWDEVRGTSGNFIVPLLDETVGTALSWSDIKDRNWTSRDYNDSPLGESLNLTLEAKPNGPWRRTDFEAVWPNLRQNITDSGTVFEHKSWRDANDEFWTTPPFDRWQTIAEGTDATPILSTPWGERVISRNFNDGFLVEYVESYTLKDFNPLVSGLLLEASGIASTVDEWRSNRDPSEAWNDSWGNPLLAAAMTYHAPRYDFDHPESIDGFDGEIVGGAIRANHDGQLVSRELLGGRDFLYRKAIEVYGHARAVYLTAGAAGSKVHESDVLDDWTVDRDTEVLRALWRQIVVVGRAEEWTESGLTTPPWRGVRIESPQAASEFFGTVDDVFLRAPSVIR